MSGVTGCLVALRLRAKLELNREPALVPCMVAYQVRYGTFEGAVLSQSAPRVTASFVTDMTESSACGVGPTMKVPTASSPAGTDREHR